MKKEKTKIATKPKKKEIRKNLSRDLANKLKTAVAEHGKLSDKVSKIITKEVKQMAKKIAKNMEINPSTFAEKEVVVSTVLPAPAEKVKAPVISQPINSKSNNRVEKSNTATKKVGAKSKVADTEKTTGKP